MTQQWMALLRGFHGGDDGLRDSPYRMQADNADEIEQKHGRPSPQLMAFIKQANAAGA